MSSLPGGFGVGGGVVFEVQPVTGGGVEAGEDEGVALLVGNSAAKSIHHALLLRGIPVLHGIPVHAIRARGDVVELRVTNERTQFLFVEGMAWRAASLLRGSTLLCPA